MSTSSVLKNSRSRKRVKTSALTDIKDVENEMNEIAEKLSKLDPNSPDPIVLKTRERLTAKWHEHEKKIPSLEKRQLEEEEMQRSNNSVSPSQLHAENLERARGAFHIHDRDSGIARHSLFYDVVQYLNDSTDSSLERRPELSNELSGVDEDEWKKLANSVEALAAENRLHSIEPGDLRGREAYYSEGLARCLTKFTSRNNLPFLFSHQLACNAHTTKEDSADVAAFYTKNNGKDCLLGLVEVKKVPDGKAKWQLSCYLSEAFESNLLGRHQRISFGLTIDQDKINLYGFRWGDEEGALLEHSLLWSAGLIETINDGGKILKAYFRCLAALSNPEVREAAPYNDFCPLVRENVIYNSAKVFHNKTKTSMHKLFDYGKFRKKTRQPNDNVIKAAYSGRVDCSVVVKEDNFGMVSLLTTPWFNGNHEPTCPEHIAKICDQLKLLHDQGMKHQDALCQNMIFGFQGDEPTAYLIDFDYAHLGVYPESWNTRFLERHPESREGEETCSSHDVYAAIAILCNYFTWSDKEETLSDEFAAGTFTKDEHPKLKQKWENASAGTVGHWLRENDKSLVPKVELTHEQELVLQQTGSPPEKKGRP